MGWVWRDDADDSSSSGDSSVFSGDSRNPRSSSFGGGERCATRKIVKTQCRTEETEPGKFFRKCEKTEQVLRDCVGRPSEVMQSNTEYTEEDVTDQMLKGSSAPLQSSEQGPFDFPGLRRDIEAIERSFFGGINRFFEAVEEMRNGFFSAFGMPDIHGDSSPPANRGIPIEDPLPKGSSSKTSTSDGEVDLSGLARDV